MKKIVLLFVVFFTLFTAEISAQSEHYRVIQNNFEKVKINFTVDRISPVDVKTDQGLFTRIAMDGYMSSASVGNPELPVMVKMIEIPLCDGIHITATPGDYVIYDAAELGINHPVFPAQPSYSKSYEGPIDLIKNAATYQTNAFYGSDLATVEKVGVMRDMSLATVYISPVQYNPVTNQIKVYTSVDVEITFDNADMPGTYQMKSKYGNGVFLGAQSMVINPIVSQNRDEISTAPIKYLIVANSMFRGQLDNFMDWKKRRGYIVEIGYTDQSTVGTTTTSIKNFILSHYTEATEDNPAPTYVLLVGDVAQIPSYTGVSSTSHITDLYYFTWTSGDNIPDCYYGRFSAQNISQLSPQIEKTLMYEHYEMPDPSYLDKAVLVAGTDANFGPTHGNGQMNYLADNYINTAYGFSNVYLHLYNCSSQAATIRSEIGAGVGYANYTAHCGSDGWGDPSFSTSNISAMNNANKYGLMIGNCCLSGKFDDSECFGEAIVRAADKGAFAYIGASNSTYWDEDFYWSVGARSTINASPSYDASYLGAYDRQFHTHSEPYSSWFTSNGAMVMGGDLAVESSTSDANSKLYYWEIYHLFGDPSVMTYLTQPAVMTVSAQPALLTGASSFTVQAVPYAYVALTYNLDLVGAAFADASGNAVISFDPLTVPGEYELAVSAQNYQPYFQTINVIVPEGSYVIAMDVPLSSGSYPQYSSSVNWDLSLKNLGVANATGVYATISTTSPYLNITVDSIYVGNININADSTFNSAFSAQIAQYVEDETIADLVVTIHFDTSETVKNISTTLFAPEFSRNGFSLTQISGNSDGVVDPGESYTLTVNDINIGHADIGYVNSALVSHYSLVSIENSLFPIGYMAVQGTSQSLFNINIGDSVETGTIIPLYYRIRSGNYEALDTLFITIGSVSETFENNNFTTYNWVNGASYPWQIATSGAYAGTHCAKSYASLPDSQTSSFQITLNVLMDDEISYYRKVSSESGYDYFKFYIDDVAMEELTGEVSWGISSFPVTAGTHIFRFDYSKDGSWTGGSDCAWIDNVKFPATGQFAPEDSVVDFPESIQNTLISNSLTVYPNPASSQIIVSADCILQSVEIIDFNGKLVNKIIVSSGNQMTINVSDLAAGIYFVRVIDEKQQVAVRKFIKK
jgi:hypothetical protein